MRRTILILTLLVFAVTGAFAQYEQVGLIKGTVHDLSATGTASQGNAVNFGTGITINGICIFCHTAHPAKIGSQAPLWNHGLTTQSYTVYASTVYGDAINGAQSTVANTSITGACLSCHDGSVAYNTVYDVGSIYNLNATPTTQTLGGSTATLKKIWSGMQIGSATGNDGKGTHPVGIDYLTARNVNAKLAVATAGTNGAYTVGTDKLPLFPLTANNSTYQMLECASCHQPHDPVNAPFLRVNNDASTLCMECHT